VKAGLLAAPAGRAVAPRDRPTVLMAVSGTITFFHTCFIRLLSHTDAWRQSQYGLAGCRLVLGWWCPREGDGFSALAPDRSGYLSLL